MDNYTAKLEDVLKPEIIDLNMEANSQEEAVRRLGELLLKDGRIDDLDLFVEDVLEREVLESTNMDIGVAIPHGTSRAIRANSIAIGRLINPIEWNKGENKQKVKVVFLMAIVSENRDRTHLELLSKMATLLLKEQFIRVLFNTTDKQELLNTVNDLLKE